MRLSKATLTGFILLVSSLMVLGARAASPYNISVSTMNESEFPRVQMTMEISGETTGMLSKHVDVIEGGQHNYGPQVLLPPHETPGKIDLHVLIDTEGVDAHQEQLIKTNLKSLAEYLFASDLYPQIYLFSLDGSQQSIATDERAAVNAINEIEFSEARVTTVDGFSKITEFVNRVAGRDDAQDVLLLINASYFTDILTDYASGAALTAAINAIAAKNYLAFVWGYPFHRLQGVEPQSKADEPVVDFAHSVPGGYWGGFGAELTPMVDLLKMQNPSEFVLQYYSRLSPFSYIGNQAVIRVDGFDTYFYNYSASQTSEVAIGHLPPNELVLGEDVPIDIDLNNYGKMINTVEANYIDKEDQLQVIPLPLKRAQSDADILRFEGAIPADEVNDKNFSYNISVYTPYNTNGASSGMASVPVNAYDDGIILKATLVNNEEVLWTWEGPTVVKGKEFEVWSGDTLLTTTKEKNYSIRLNDCNRYQIVQVKVIFADGTKSYPSRPYEYYADTGNDGLITEKEAAELMIQCVETKEIGTYTQLLNITPDFKPGSNISLERAGIYLAKVIAEDIWRRVEAENGYYELMYYIMIFINRDEYQTYGLNGTLVKESLIHKLISKVNHTEDINAAFNNALDEISRRLRNQTSL